MLKVATVCSGIGAPEKALKMLGIPYELSFFSEIDIPAIKAYCAIHKESTNKNFGNLENINQKPIPQDLDLLVGGTPCQDFSNAGLGKGGEEGSGTRSSLMWYYIKLIALSKPKIVVWENVAAVISIKHIHTYRKFCHTLSGLGYRLNADILNAKYFNVPQNRTRLILVAVRKDLKIDFEYPHGYDSGVRIKDLLEHKVNDKYYTKTLDDVEPYNRYFADTFRIMPLGKIKGAIYKQCNEVLCIEGIFDCLTTKQGNYILDEHSSREKNIRHLTPLEALRFMGFEDKDYYKSRYFYCKNESTGKKERIVYVSETDIYSQAGNSIVVTVLMAVFGQLYGVEWEHKVFGKRYKTPFELLCELPMFAVLRENCKNDET